MTEMTETTETTTTATTMAEKTVCMQVRLGALGTRQRIDPQEVIRAKQGGEITDEQADMLHVGKDILKAAELQAIRKHAGEIRAYVRARSLPSLLRGGIYVVPIELVGQIDDSMESFATVRRGLVEKFVQAYSKPDGLIAQAKVRLEPLGQFDEADYPTPAAVRKAFTLDVRYLSFSTPAGLAGIKKGLFEREKRKFERAWATAQEQAVSMLRAEMQGFVEHMLDRLSPDADGKPKVFRNTLTKGLSEFLGTFQFRNVADDKELAALVEKARGLLSNSDAESIRDSDDLRQGLAKGLTAIKAKLDPMVGAKPSRLIRFDADEAVGQ